MDSDLLTPREVTEPREVALWSTLMKELVTVQEVPEEELG